MTKNSAVKALLPTLALLLLLAFAVPVYADATVTFHNLTTAETVYSTTCSDGSTVPGGTLTVTANGVIHFNIDQGGAHLTETETGPFTLTGTTNGVNYAGYITEWFGGTAQVTSAGFFFTATVHAQGTGSDGSQLSFTINTHITVTPDGTVTASFANYRC